MSLTTATTSYVCERSRSEVRVGVLAHRSRQTDVLTVTATGNCLAVLWLNDVLGQFCQQVSITWRAEKRGYTPGPIAWKSHKKQKFHCGKCNRSFPRMEVLLQHFRDSVRHRYFIVAASADVMQRRQVVKPSKAGCGAFCSQEAVSLEASVQMSNWLLAKDQGWHCCRTCCLGFQTEAELFVHLKHTAVHKVLILSQILADW